MDDREHRNPGSQIRALSTDTSLSEVYAVGQFLAEMTKSRPARQTRRLVRRRGAFTSGPALLMTIPSGT